MVVKFAESDKDKQRTQQQKQVQSQAAQMQQLQLLQLANLAPLLTQQLYAQSAWDQYSQQLTAGQGMILETVIAISSYVTSPGYA